MKLLGMLLSRLLHIMCFIVIASVRQVSELTQLTYEGQ